MDFLWWLYGSLLLFSGELNNVVKPVMFLLLLKAQESCLLPLLLFILSISIIQTPELLTVTRKVRILGHCNVILYTIFIIQYTQYIVQCILLLWTNCTWIVLLIIVPISCTLLVEAKWITITCTILQDDHHHVDLNGKMMNAYNYSDNEDAITAHSNFDTESIVKYVST